MTIESVILEDRANYESRLSAFLARIEHWNSQYCMRLNEFLRKPKEHFELVWIEQTIDGVAWEVFK